MWKTDFKSRRLSRSYKPIICLECRPLRIIWKHSNVAFLLFNTFLYNPSQAVHCSWFPNYKTHTYITPFDRFSQQKSSEYSLGGVFFAPPLIFFRPAHYTDQGGRWFYKFDCDCTFPPPFCPFFADCECLEKKNCLLRTKRPVLLSLRIIDRPGTGLASFFRPVSKTVTLSRCGREWIQKCT